VRSTGKCSAHPQCPTDSSLAFNHLSYAKLRPKHYSRAKTLLNHNAAASKPQLKRQVKQSLSKHHNQQDVCKNTKVDNP
jgi:hypothetical protein